MKVKNLQIKKAGKRIILNATLEFSSGLEKNVFLSVPKKYESCISDSYDAFLAAALIPCMKTKEDLEISGEVSTEFLKSIRQVMLKIESWSLGLNRISIKANKVIKAIRAATSLLLT